MIILRVLSDDSSSVESRRIKKWAREPPSMQFCSRLAFITYDVVPKVGPSGWFRLWKYADTVAIGSTEYISSFRKVNI